VENSPEGPQLTPEEYERLVRLQNIFMPFAAEQRLAHFAKMPNQTHARLIHYTTAEAALAIINSKSLWMRNTNLMSDYREVQYGLDMFRGFFGDPNSEKAFTEALENCSKDVGPEALEMFAKTWNDTRFNTYISCFSEHDDKEDMHGRLSMWRAFGGGTGRVGIVLKIPWVSQVTIPLSLLFSPVAYLAEQSVKDVMQRVIENITQECVFLRSVGRDELVRTVFNMLMAGVVCLKHPGFLEEREWRAIYFPKRWPSSLMQSATTVLGGIPQVVYKIPLDERVSERLADIDFARIFDRLIVGPTPFPWPMFDPFVDALERLA
jgi:hypothetical protein